MELNEMLEKQLRKDFETLATSDDVSVRKEAESRIERFYRIKMEEQKQEADIRLRENEAAFHEQKATLEFREQTTKNSRDLAMTIAKLGLETVIFGGTLAFNSTFMKRGFIFEETGAYTSQTFRNLWQKFGRK